MMFVYSDLPYSIFQIMAAKVVSRIMPQLGIGTLQAKEMSRDPAVVSQFISYQIIFL